MSACGVCGKAMVHFTNPDRQVCPNEGAHAQIIAQRQRRLQKPDPPGSHKGRMRGQPRDSKGVWQKRKK